MVKNSAIVTDPREPGNPYSAYSGISSFSCCIAIFCSKTLKTLIMLNFFNIFQQVKESVFNNKKPRQGIFGGFKSVQRRKLEPIYKILLKTAQYYIQIFTQRNDFK